MRIFVGYLCFVSYLFMFVKLFTRICGWKKADKFLMKIHVHASGVFCLSLLLHFILGLFSHGSGSVAEYILGGSAAALSFLLITLCHTMKDPKERCRLHRILSVVIFAALVCHVLV